ncbi:hypothetical protein X989_5393 [Burkholderia pseudomallei MSHR4378]|nr:hypothetical protein X989_5393 [Burkholderia pseudomallei MSHR4378]
MNRARYVAEKFIFLIIPPAMIPPHPLTTSGTGIIIGDGNQYFAPI